MWQGCGVVWQGRVRGRVGQGGAGQGGEGKAGSRVGGAEEKVMMLWVNACEITCDGWYVHEYM